MHHICLGALCTEKWILIFLCLALQVHQLYYTDIILDFEGIQFTPWQKALVKVLFGEEGGGPWRTRRYCLGSDGPLGPLICTPNFMRSVVSVGLFRSSSCERRGQLMMTLHFQGGRWTACQKCVGSDATSSPRPHTPAILSMAPDCVLMFLTLI